MLAKFGISKGSTKTPDGELLENDPLSVSTIGLRLLHLREANQKWQDMRQKIWRRYGLSRARYKGPKSGRLCFLTMVDQVRNEASLMVSQLQDHFATPAYHVREFAVAEGMLESIININTQLLRDVETYMRDTLDGYSDEERQEDLRTVSAVNWSHHHMMTEIFPLARCRFRHLVAFILLRQETDNPYTSCLHLLCDGAHFLAQLEKCDVLHRVRKGISSMATAYERRGFVRSCKSAVALFMLSAYVGMSHCSLGMCHGVQFRAAVSLVKFILKLMLLDDDGLPPELVVESLPVCRASLAKFQHLHGAGDFPNAKSCSCPLSDQDRAALKEGFATMGKMVSKLQAIYPLMVSRYQAQLKSKKNKWFDAGDSLIHMDSAEEMHEASASSSKDDDLEEEKLFQPCLLERVMKSNLCREELRAMNAVLRVLENGWLSDPALSKLLGNHVIPFLECELQDRHESIAAKRQKLEEYSDPPNVEPLVWNPFVGLMMRVTLGDSPLVPRLSNGMTIEEMMLKVDADAAVGSSTLTWDDVEPSRFCPIRKIDKLFGAASDENQSRPGETTQKSYEKLVEGSIVFQFVPGPGSGDDDRPPEPFLKDMCCTTEVVANSGAV